MTSSIAIPQASESHIAFAAKWAEIFCHQEPEKKQEFIEHYVKSTLELRFWGDASFVNEQKIAFCRLGVELMLVFHDGIIRRLRIHKGKVAGLKIPPAELGPTRKKAMFMKGLERKLTASDSCEKTKRTIHYDYSFDTLTSFSKQAHNEAVAAMNADILSSLKIYPQPKKNRYAGFYSISVKKYTGWFGIALKKFLAEVDQQTLFTIRSVRCPSIGLYNWLASGNKERRLQAVKGYPVLVPMEVMLQRSNFEEHDSSKISELSALIDRGESFNSLLAETYEVRPSLMKKIGKLSPYSIGSAVSFLKYNFMRNAFGTALYAFNLGSKKPQKPRGWRNCMMAISHSDIRFNESTLAGMPPWESAEWDHLIPQVRNLYDIGDVRHILGEVGLKKALSFSSEWHEKQHEIQQDVLSKVVHRSSYTWPGMLKGEVIHPKTGLSIVEITDNVELAVEGSKMGHCVGGYASYCFSAQSRIISIRDGKTPLATLEFRPVKSNTGKKSYECVQAQGPGNRSFNGTPAYEAFRWFTKNLRSHIATYDLEPVPKHLQPLGRNDLSREVSARIREWADKRMIELGYSKEMEALQAKRDDPNNNF